MDAWPPQVLHIHTCMSPTHVHMLSGDQSLGVWCHSQVQVCMGGNDRLSETLYVVSLYAPTYMYLLEVNTYMQCIKREGEIHAVSDTWAHMSLHMHTNTQSHVSTCTHTCLWTGWPWMLCIKERRSNGGCYTDEEERTTLGTRREGYRWEERGVQGEER